MSQPLINAGTKTASIVLKPIFSFALLALTVFGQAKTDADVRPLSVGQPIERELKGDEAHSYSLALTAKQYLDLVVEQKGVDVVVALFDANGKKVIEVDSPNGTQGAEPIALIIETAGNYRLEVRSLEKTAAAGRYEVKIKELRTATEKDKNRIAANKAFNEAVTLRQQGTAESLRNAIKKFEESLPLLRAVGDKGGEALTLGNIGGVYFNLGEQQQALKFFSESLPLLRAVGDKRGEAFTLSIIGNFYSTLGEQQQALKFYNEALPLHRAVSNKGGEALTLNNIAEVYSFLGDKQQALKVYNEALPLHRAIGDKQGEAATLNSIGKVYSTLGEKQQALKFFNEALPLARAANDKRIEATMLNNIGYIYSTLGEKQKALEYYNQALQIFRAIGDKGGEATSLNNIGEVYSDLGEKQKALEYYNQALQISRAIGDKFGEASRLNNIGKFYSTLGENQKALEYYNQGLQIFRAIGDKEGEATSLNNIGEVYSDLGEKQKALEFYNQALPLYRAVADRDGEATTFNNIGGVYSALGENQKALEYYNQALQISRAIGDKDGEASRLNNIGSVYSDLGENRKALEYITQALPLRRAVGDKFGEARTLNNIGKIHFDSGENKQALKFFNEVLPLSRAIGDKEGEATTLNNIGIVYDALGEKQQALKFYKAALPVRRAIGDKQGEAVTLVNIGTIHFHLGEKKQALKFFNEALPLSRTVGDKRNEAVTLNNLFSSLALDNPRFGVFYGKLSVNNYQLLRSNVQGLDKNIQQTFLKSIESTYRKLADVLIKQQRYAEAQQILNLFKDQQYFDFKSNKQIAPLALTERETTLVADFNQKLEAVVGAIRRLDDFKRSIGKRPPTSAESDEIKAIENRLQTASDNYQTFLRTAAQQFAAPPDETDKIPTTADLQQMQTAMRELSASTKQNTVAVYTLVGEENYRGLVITSDNIFAVSSPIKGEVLNQKAQQLWRLLRTPQYDPQPLAREIYDVVFAPLAAKLPADTKTILWSLDGNLRYVPMAALHDGKQYLVERYYNVIFTRADKERFVRNVSANLTGTGFGSSESHTVKLAGEIFNASALPSVKTELSRIFKKGNSITGILPGDFLLNERFSKARMLSELQKRQPVVHIASHFKFQAGDEARSFLLLGDGTTFTLDEMKREQNLFGGVDLLTLSACQTAAQRADASGREVDGFAELAQRLGAGAVMASLWEVSDDSTAELMARFYRNYRSRAEMNKAEALRTAQLALLYGVYKTAGATKRELTREDALTATKIKIDTAKLKPFKANKKAPFAHPFYWSPFILIGNWK